MVVSTHLLAFPTISNWSEEEHRRRPARVVGTGGETSTISPSPGLSVRAIWRKGSLSKQQDWLTKASLSEKRQFRWQTRPEDHRTTITCEHPVIKSELNFLDKKPFTYVSVEVWLRNVICRRCWAQRRFSVRNLAILRPGAGEAGAQFNATWTGKVFIRIWTRCCLFDIALMYRPSVSPSRRIRSPY